MYKSFYTFTPNPTAPPTIFLNLKPMRKHRMKTVLLIVIRSLIMLLVGHFLTTEGKVVRQVYKDALSGC